MTRRHYVNNAASNAQTSGSLTSGATTVTISDLSTFPATFPYTAVINAGEADVEIVLVNSATGNNITSMTRGYDGTSAQSHASNATFQHVAVKADYDEANSHVNATTGVHGIAGALVGTTDTQTLSGKTLTTPTVNGGTVTGAAVDSTTTLGGTAISSLPKGRVISGTKTAGVSVTTTEALVSGLSDLSFTAVAGKRYKLIVSMTGTFGASSNNQDLNLRVRDGGASAPTTSSTVLLNTSTTTFGTSFSASGLTAVLELTSLTAGTHRFGLTAQGTAAGTLFAGATDPLTVIVEDIGV